VGLVLAGSVVALVDRPAGRAGGDGAATSSSGLASDAVMTTTTMSSAAPARAFGPGVATAKGGVASTVIGPMPPETVPGTRVTGAEPQIVRTAQLTLKVRDGAFERAVDRANTIAVAAGGFVVSSNTSSFAKGEASGELVLRVPADSFDRVRLQLRGLGDIESLSQTGDDVSSQLVDIDARVRTLRAEESGLQSLLAQAKSVNDMLQVRDRLTGVRTEIEQLAGQQAMLKDRVSYATITMSLHEGTMGEPAPGPVAANDTGIGHSVRTAANATVAVVGGMIVVLGALLPFALLALVAWALARRYGRRHAEAG